MNCNCIESMDIRGRCYPGEWHFNKCKARIDTLAFYYCNDVRFVDKKSTNTSVIEFLKSINISLSKIDVNYLIRYIESYNL